MMNDIPAGIDPATLGDDQAVVQIWNNGQVASYHTLEDVVDWLWKNKPALITSKMEATKKTPVVARECGIGYYRIISLLRSGHLPPPPKDSSGDFAWRERDVAALRKLIARDGLKNTVAV